MTAAEFKKKWSRYQGKESAAYQEHFIDLCRLLGQPTPVEADPSGNDFFCFQKRVVKGAEFSQPRAENATVFDLNDDERRIRADASEADWQYVEPSIMGTLFARGLDPDRLRSTPTPTSSPR